MNSEAPIANIAAYKFVELNRLAERKQELRQLCQQLGVKGTILLAKEGINLFLSGPRNEMTKFVETLKQDSELEDLAVKWSYSDEVAFKRTLVKIKREIIAFGINDIQPANYTSPRILPEELRKWFAERRDFVLLDTRNEFEYEMGTFQGAEQLGIESFREFPEKLEALPEDWKQKPIVTFCTGGIRCEKAAPLLEQAGFENVMQLDGGILKYFEDCGGEFYDGECFVFDRRVAVDPELNESESTICFACQHPLSPEEVTSPQFEEGVSCPYCFERDQKRNEEHRQHRENELRKLAASQPGKGPYDHERPLNMPGRVDGSRLIDALEEIFPHEDVKMWRKRIESGALVYAGTKKLIRDASENADEQRIAIGQPGEPCLEPDTIVRGGQEFRHLEKGLQEPEISDDIRIVFEDDCWLVLDKPAPLPVHPCGRYFRHTLDWMLSRVYRGQKLRPAHRLDANTTGLQLFCKSRQVSRFVQSQFESGEVHKVYLARVESWNGPGVNGLDESTIVNEPIGEASGPAGVRTIDPFGKEAVTSFAPLTKLSDGSVLILARPQTGRTNQIRVHLWHLGCPIVGDPIYLPNHQVGTRQTLDRSESPMCLHAWQLRLKHPVSNQAVNLQAASPRWLAAEDEPRLAHVEEMVKAM